MASGDSAGLVSGRMAGEARRQQILRVAMRLFSQHGFRGTTTKEIARAAGVSEAMVFRHFATKEELYSAILDYKACASSFNPRELLAEAVKRKDDRAVFVGLGAALIEHHEADPEFMRLLSHAALEEHQLVELFRERTVRAMYELLGGYIRERQHDGAFRRIEPALVVRAFLGMVIYHSLNNALFDKRRSLLDVPNERAVKAFTDLLLNGIVKTNGATTHTNGQHKSAGTRTNKRSSKKS